MIILFKEAHKDHNCPATLRVGGRVNLRQRLPHVRQQSQQVHVGLLGQEEQDCAADKGAPFLWYLQV